jgi:hypothetical protein
MTACSTTGAQIDGPTFGLGLEIDLEGNFSPHLQVGYQSSFWYDFLGYGWGTNIGWAPLVDRVDLFLEGQVYAAPLFGYPLTPFSFGLGGAWSPQYELELGGRVGLETWMFMPPEACWGPIEGDWEGCPAGASPATMWCIPNGCRVWGTWSILAPAAVGTPRHHPGGLRPGLVLLEAERKPAGARAVGTPGPSG